tara:strand:+ start:194 stop:481 length:288 start_codon:yes stop_codon:yes gene_type:complete
MSSTISKISVLKNGKHHYYIKLIDGYPIEKEDRCASCGTTCLDHTSNKGRGSESPCKECGEYRCKYCPCECGENKCTCECGENRGSCKWGEDIYK